MGKVQRTIEVRVFKFNPSLERESHYDLYRIPFIEGSSVSNVLQYINEECDGGLAHYLSCRRGICKGCTVRVNGKAVVACTEIVQGNITIEPIKQEWVVKDLIVRKNKREDVMD